MLDFIPMAAETLVPDFKVSLNGSPLDPGLIAELQVIEVQQSIGLIDMATLTLGNHKGLTADQACFAHGTDLVIELGYVGSLAKVFQGDVVAIEPEFPSSGSPLVVVRAYDRLHRYHRGRQQRTFLDMKSSDVISKLASEEGLSPQVEATSDVHPYLFQNNQSNVEMILELARKEGYEVEVTNDGKLYAGKPRHQGGAVRTSTWGEDLKGFHVRSSMNNVKTEVSVRYWDMKQKAKVLETSGPVEGQLKPEQDAVATAKKAFKDAKHQVSVRPGTSAGEAKARATAIFNERALDSVQGRATLEGDTRLVPGKIVELLGLGTMWSGLYYISGSTHIFTPEAGYANELLLRRTGTGYPVENRIIDPPSE